MFRRVVGTAPRPEVAWVAAAVAVALLPLGLAGQAGPLEHAWQAYWRADSLRAATAEGEKLLAAGVTFDDAWSRLRRGRPYPAASPGPRALRFPSQSGQAYDNTIEVPAGYDPARPWPVRVQLHGGVMRQDPEEGRRRRGQRLPPGEPQIVVEPFAWAESAWWHTTQVDNVLALVDRVKRLYNVDESRIVLTGTSDGGTGTYYLAMREPTPFAAMVPLIGHLGVLGNPATGADGELFVSNLVNRPFFVVNGLMDPKYPAARIAPYLEALQTAGVSLVFRPQRLGGHDTSWWLEERPLVERFAADHPRAPHPPLLSWETERTDRFNRVHWLVIDELGGRPGEAALPETNSVTERFDPDFGLRGDAKKDRGTRIVQVVADTDAARLGLMAGDRLLEIDGRPVDGLAAVQAAFDRNTGPRIRIAVERRGSRLDVEGPFPPQPRRGPPQPIFRHRRPSGRVDVVRRGNAFEARTRGVARFTLLLSPDAVDFARPVVVTVNGRVVHDAPVERDVRALVRWAARDNDRTMLYGAALPVAVPQATSVAAAPRPVPRGRPPAARHAARGTG